ncbi:hypothetical protein PRIPAC_78176 [Pristionchus pacificus]|uniref:Uncharacterized protein n=1 Tax=Pristionchus pacificus TaxID=54126 RepID=A0A2A6C3R8_PRIPA|nr:hypothetical protein PRIPAC_78176 [Pristionchus pacificus]|eukprot:PDM72770.1 hypothetical protein PRIPAC_39204 [Pristionchus pacificus]
MMVRAGLLLLLAVQNVFAATCFLTESSTTPYIAMSVTIEESVKWCYTACDSTPGCVSVVYNGTDGSCVKQSASTNLASPASDDDICFLLEYQSEGTNKVFSE